MCELSCSKRGSGMMADVQNDPAQWPLSIDRVGVKGLQLPLLMSDKSQGRQHTLASICPLSSRART